MAYKVPFVDFPLHYRRLETEILATIKEVLGRGDLILRDQLRQFESNIASFLGMEHAIGLNSGTDALYLSLRAAGIGPGDEVITVAHTFVATIAVIVHCGAKPVLVDVGEDFNMDMDQVEPTITPRTKAIIPVHLNGRLCDMEKLMALARKHKLLVIEDAAQALGAKFDGRKAGTFGLTGCFSLYPAKVLGGFGDGGIVVTNDADTATRIRLLRDHGQRRETGDVLCFGFNSRLDNLHAAILDVKLRYLNGWLQRRRELAALYQRGLSDLADVKLPPPPQAEGRYYDVFQNYVVRARDRDRDRLVGYLKDSGVEVLVNNPIPVHHHQALGLQHFRLPMTERLAQEVVSLPLNPEISNEQAEVVISSVRSFYSGRPSAIKGSK